MRKLFFAVLLSALIIAEFIFSQDKSYYYHETAKKVVTEALNKSKGYEYLKELCEIGPRLAGSKNSLKAIDWAVNKFKEIGVDTVWLQPVMVNSWERGDIETAAIIGSNNNPIYELSVASLGNSVGTDNDGISAEVLEVHNFEELKLLFEEAKSKIIFFNRPFDNTLINTFEAYGKAVDQRIFGAAEAAKVGGIGVLVRSVTSLYDNVPHVGTMIYADSVKQIPAAALGTIDADYLSGQLKKNPNLKIKMTLSCRSIPDQKSYNVIAEIRGIEKPEEVIVVGGHFDSWDKGDGAHDDGAPTLQTLEILDLIKRLNLQPKRTIRCIFFMNEENGSEGAVEYAKFAESENSTHIAAIESDRGAFTPRGFYVTTDSTRLSKLQSWLPFLDHALIEWIKPGGSGADISKIKIGGALMGYVPDVQRYFDVHHSDNDVFETVNSREMEFGSAAMTILAFLLSEEGI
ncbi:MAG: M20/M25/M40 family metallo-hydrolase [Bacteroidetes bacterium]|nr:M20/M25/M40 family metallo-hydrolase [Bacteroidota bacterium]